MDMLILILVSLLNYSKCLKIFYKIFNFKNNMKMVRNRKIGLIFNNFSGFCCFRF